MPETKISRIRETDNKAAILFVHGFGGDYLTTWGNFPNLICQDDSLKDWDVYSFGYDSNLMPDWLRGLWTADANITELGLLLDTTIRADFQGIERWILVGHSMGGLVIQSGLIDHEDLAKKTERVVTFGTPSNGLEKARPFSWSKGQVKQMGKGSEFMQGLAQGRAQRFVADKGLDSSKVLIDVVAGERDQFVPPSSSLGGFESKRCHLVPGDHLSIVKPGSAKDASYQLLNALINDNELQQDSAAVALERGEFQRVIELLEPSAAQGTLTNADAGRLALARCNVGGTEVALAGLRSHLESRGESPTDALGILAGRLKRVFLSERNSHHGKEALALYGTAYERANGSDDHNQAHYHAINVAFMKAALGDPGSASVREEVQDWARIALRHAEEADDEWRGATKAEAMLYLGMQDAVAMYVQAWGAMKEPWQQRSSYVQACAFLNWAGDEERLSELEQAFRGLHE